MKKKILYSLTKFIVVIFLMGILAVIYSSALKIQDDQKIVLEQKKKIDSLFEIVESNLAYLQLYTIYGNHLNFNGYILKESINNIEIKDINLVLKDTENNQIEFELKYDINDDKVLFYLAQNINEGLDLNKVQEGVFYSFIKINGASGEEEIQKLFSIKNISQYGEQNYYTVTKDKTNNKVELLFRQYEENSLDYMQIIIEKSTLPSRIYDIVIDAGHGGKDGGASYNGNKESDFTLEYSNALKQKLEEQGYKVKLTRAKDEYIESYGKNGRAIVSYETEAKLVLSIHLNSSITPNGEGGVEIYAPNKANLEFAKMLADNIVSYASTNYSINSYARTLDGVYVRTYTDAEIQEAIEYANDLDYIPYETLSIDTPYLFMIRETGGIMTKAYVDGRNRYIDNNPYYNSNISAEAYLLELGFINCDKDVNNLIQNKEAYINAIVDSIVKNYN